MVQAKKFQPLVLDEKGTIRERFNLLSKNSHIKKEALAGKVFEAGLQLLEKKNKKLNELKSHS